jgi:hypothetical protein
MNFHLISVFRYFHRANWKKLNDYKTVCEEIKWTRAKEKQIPTSPNFRTETPEASSTKVIQTTSTLMDSTIQTIPPKWTQEATGKSKEMLNLRKEILLNRLNIIPRPS